jgi:hypothetical protein
MNSSRRSFLKQRRGCNSRSALMPDSVFAAPKKIQRVGLQLYSVRDAMKVDPAGGFKKTGRYGLRICRTCQLYKPQILRLHRKGIQKTTGRPWPGNAKRPHRNDTAALGCRQKRLYRCLEMDVEDAAFGPKICDKPMDGYRSAYR